MGSRARFLLACGTSCAVPLLGLAGCGAGAEPTETLPEARAELPACVPSGSEILFARAPSGAREVAPEWLAFHRCEVHVVDVRSREELDGPLGRIEGAEWVPLETLEARAVDWSSDEPVVLVDRSGRRASDAAELLGALGIHGVASLTGGLLAWRAAGLPTVDGPLALSSTAAIAPVPTTLDPVRARLEDAGRISWVSVASIVGAGTQHCIDGRAHGPVVGTPGGDAGELTLALSAVEHTARAEVPLTAVADLVAAYAESFGRFYLHTDHEALARLEQAIAADPSLAQARGDGAIELFVVHPPAELEDALASLLARPDLVGCGHLRLLLEHPEEYGVRRELAEAVIRETHRLRWRRPELVDFEILEGLHEERAVVRVLLDRPIHSYSRVPTFPAREGDTASFFVSHPEVSAYLRSELGSFLSEQEETLSLVSGAHVRRRPLARAALDHELAALADRQINATLRHLARELPVYEVHMRTGQDGESAPTVSGPNASLGCASY